MLPEGADSAIADHREPRNIDHARDEQGRCSVLPGEISARMATRIWRHAVRLHSGRAPHVGSAPPASTSSLFSTSGAAQLDSARPRDPGRDRVIPSKATPRQPHGLLHGARLPASRAAGGACGRGQRAGRASVLPDASGSSARRGSGPRPRHRALGMATGMRLAGPAWVRFRGGIRRRAAPRAQREAALWAPPVKPTNLCCIVDANGLQATGRTAQITRIEPLVGKGGSLAERPRGGRPRSGCAAPALPPRRGAAHRHRGAHHERHGRLAQWRMTSSGTTGRRSWQALLRALAELAEDMP